MNTISLNNLWSYIQGLSLTTSNKKWLADHLNEAVRKEQQQVTKEDFIAEAASVRKANEKKLWDNAPKLKPEDIKIASWADEMVKDIPSMTLDGDVDKQILDYLLKKHK